MRYFSKSAAAGCLLACAATPDEQTRWDVDPTPILDITGTTPSGEVAFELATGATRLDDGTIVLADGLAPAIRYFDGSGREIRSVGRKGRGPGEFQTISWLGRCGADSLLIYDLMTRETSVHSASGAFVRRFRTPGNPGLVSCSRQGTVAVLGVAPTPPKDPTARVVASLTLADAAGMTRATVPGVPFYDVIMVRGYPMASPLGRTTAFTVGPDKLYVGSADSASIDVYSLAGQKVATIHLDAPRRPATRRHFERAADGFVRYAKGEAAAMMKRSILETPMPDFLPPYSALSTDQDGALWVVLSMPGDPETRLRAIDGDGKPRGEVAIPRDLTIFEIGRDYILGAYESEDGEPHVAMYRLRRTR